MSWVTMLRLIGSESDRMGYNLPGNFLETVVHKGLKIVPAVSWFMVCGDQCIQLWPGLETPCSSFQSEFFHYPVMIQWSQSYKGRKFLEDFHSLLSSPWPKQLLALCSHESLGDHVSYWFKWDIPWSHPYIAGILVNLLPSFHIGSDKVWIVWRTGFGDKEFWIAAATSAKILRPRIAVFFTCVERLYFLCVSNAFSWS